MHPFQIKTADRKKEAETSARTESRIEILDSLAAWEALSGSWNSLLKSSRSDTLFLTWEWLFSWAECFLKDDRKLCIATVYVEDELVGIAPWCLHRVERHSVSLTQLEFLGTPETASDYLDVIIKKGREEQVADLLYDFLFDRSRVQWDCLCLRDIPSDSLFLLHFRSRIEKAGKYAEIDADSYCPRVTIPDGSDWVPAGVSSKRRARFRQDLGRLNRDGDWLHGTDRGEAVQEAIDEFFSMYGKMTGYESETLHRFMQQYASRTRGQDRIRIDGLSIRGVKTAAFLHLQYGEDILLYAMAVDKSFNTKISLGNVLIGLSLEEAHREGRKRYDFLKGHEPYKFYWADDCRVTLSLFTAGGGIRPFLFLLVQSVVNIGKAILR